MTFHLFVSNFRCCVNSTRHLRDGQQLQAVRVPQLRSDSPEITERRRETRNQHFRNNQEQIDDAEMTLGEHVDHVTCCAHGVPKVAWRVDIFTATARTATHNEVAARAGVVNSRSMPTVRLDRLRIPCRRLDELRTQRTGLVRSLYGHERSPGAAMRDTFKLQQETRLDLAVPARIATLEIATKCQATLCAALWICWASSRVGEKNSD